MPPPPESAAPVHPRYHRQTLLPQIGAEGQHKLAHSTAAIIGLGALGTVLAEHLARAGVGRLILADRDLVEPTNLQRQTLYTESDAENALPKAVAAAARLARINSGIHLDPHPIDVNPATVEPLVRDADLILDGTDNVQTRYLLNDVSVKLNRPYVYGAAVALEGRVAAFRPPDTPCLRCLFPTPPSPTELATCDTAGVLAPVTAIVASHQALLGLQLLLAPATVPQHLYAMTFWPNTLRTLNFEGAKDPACPACALRRYDSLNAPPNDSVSLCGRDALQVLPRPGQGRISLEQIAARLAPIGPVDRQAFFVRCRVDDAVVLTVFPDARMVLEGTTDANRAKSLYARYIGS